jgi:hypothetical protein
MYRSFHVISALRNGHAEAAVFIGRSLCTRLNAPSIEAAEALGVQWVDNHMAEQRRLRGESQNIGTVDDYLRALSLLSFNDKQWAMLIAHSRAPDRILTPTGLAQACGAETWQVANSQYGKAGRAIGELLELTPLPLEPVNRSNLWTSILANPMDRDDDHPYFRWQQHETLSIALGRHDRASRR